MKPTGIIRAVDDLGRVVIPKSVRDAVGIEFSERMEIFYDENGVYFKKYTNYSGQEDFSSFFR